MAASNEQTFSFDTVAVLLSASGIVVGSQHYKIMTALDNTKTASGYEHMFRKVKARAKEITEMREKGDFGVESPTPAKKGKAVDGGGKDGGSKKRGKSPSAQFTQSPDLLMLIVLT